MKKIKLFKVDLKILHFLWRWKIMSTSGLSLHLYGKKDEEYVYRRLLFLNKHRFIVTHTNNHDSKVLWGMDRKGFKLIRDNLPALCGQGYRSESPRHDFLCSSFQLGPYISKASGSLEFFTEQELRHIRSDEFPNWVPQDTSHRCDGLWKLSVGNETYIFALEVELGRQKTSHYQSIGRYYENNQAITRIIWLVANENAANRLQQIFEKEVGANAKYHNFIYVSDALANGWNCKIKLGSEEGQSMSELMNNGVSNLNPSVDFRWTLNLSKSPITKGAYQMFCLQDFCL